MKPWFDIPVFNWYAGQLTTIYVGQYIRSAQDNYPEARRLTPKEWEALELLDSLTNDPALNLQMTMSPGERGGIVTAETTLKFVLQPE